MNIVLIGINHITAPIEIRENFYLNQIEQDYLLSELKNHPAFVGALVLSTCNRTEIYAQVIDATIEASFLIELLTKIKRIDSNDAFEQYFYRMEGHDAIKHLFHVSTSLDSLVLGEKQILGQVKKSFENAQEKGFLTTQLNILGNLAIRAGKKAQNETHIGFGGNSVSWAAIAKAESLLGSLENKTVLFIGAGKMSKLAVGQIRNKGFHKLFLMNRTQEHAQALAEKFHGEAVSFADLKEILAQVDLCICSSSAPHWIVDFETVKKALDLRDQRSLLMIDISMPRNIDPRVNTLDNVNLLHIDDLKTVVEENILIRQQAVREVENIVADKFHEYFEKIQKIQDLRDGKLSQVIEAER